MGLSWKKIIQIIILAKLTTQCSNFIFIFRFISQKIDINIRNINYHIKKKTSSTEGCGNASLQGEVVYIMTKKSS